MAGDWIKMRVDLADDPAVISIGAAVNIGEDLVVGKLHRVWAWADKHTENGSIPGVSKSWIDKLTGVIGFADAMESAGWLAADSDSIRFPNFDRHNGKSAKKRASNAKRQECHRGRNASVTHLRNKKAIVSRTIRKQVCERDGWKCQYCGREKGQLSPQEVDRDGYMTLDHVIPESNGGDSSPLNLVACCNSCNQIKGDRTPDEAGMKWPCDVTGKRYGSVTEALPEKRREEKSKDTPIGVSCTEPPKTCLKPQVVVMTFPCVGRDHQEWRLTESKIAEYQESFPGIDVLAHCRNARQWCIDNPKKQKTFSGMPAFLSRWLAKEQNRGQSTTQPSREQIRQDNSFDAIARATGVRISPVSSGGLEENHGLDRSSGEILVRGPRGLPFHGTEPGNHRSGVDERTVP